MPIDYKCYPDEQAREKFVNHLNQYSCVDIQVPPAKSLCGRNIYQLNIGNIFCDPVLLVGAFHGMEWLTSLILFKFTETLCKVLEAKRKIYNVEIFDFFKKRGLIIIPCVNPDGVEISLHGENTAQKYKNLVSRVSCNDTLHWQANARGVDLNHNFNAEWTRLHQMEQAQGFTGPSPTRYGGPYPESEPETQFLVNLSREKKFRHVVAFHSQGEEIYWNFGKNTPPKSRYLVEIMSFISGYKISEPEGLALGGGFKDWFIQEFKRPGFTIEIGKGKNPLPLSDLSNIYNRIEKMLVFISIL